MRFLSWNVNGIRAAEKKGFADIVRDFDADFFCVQETKARPEQLSEDLLHLGGYESYWESAEKKGYSGVAVYAKKEPLSVRAGIGSPEHDTEGRALTLEYEDFYLLNLYFPNAQPKLARLEFKLSFDRALKDYADGLGKNKTVVLCGDFNVAHKPIDLKNPESNEKNPGFSPEERAWMDEFLEEGYVDAFRLFNQEPDNYTWWSYRFNARARNIGWRIDYFCVNGESRDRVAEAPIFAEILGSDHCPVGLTLR